MNRNRIILVAVLIVAASAAVMAQTLESVVNRAIEAQGGKARLESIQSMAMTMNGTMMGSMTVNMDMKIKKPNKFHMKMDMMGQNMTMISDGNDYWMEMMGRTMDVPANQAAGNQQLTQGFGDMLLQLQQMGAEYAGMAEFMGESCHAVTFQPEGADQPGTMYFSDASGMMIGFAQNTAQGEAKLHITSYQDVDGIKFPQNMVMHMNGSEMMNLSISNVQVNPAIDDSLFVRK